MWYNPDYYPWGAPKGWVCGSCGRSFAPHVSECPYCNNREVKRTTTTTWPSMDDSEWWNEYLKRSSTAKTTKDIDDLIKSTADSASINNPTTTWEVGSGQINQATAPKNIKVTAYNTTAKVSNVKSDEIYCSSNGTTVGKIGDPSSATVCSGKCEECNKYNKSCFGGVETTESKAIISHRKPLDIHYSSNIDLNIAPCNECAKDWLEAFNEQFK